MATMGTQSISLLDHRQDEISPVKIVTHIPELGDLEGWRWPNGVRQYFGIPYGAISKKWTRSTLVTSWVGGKHDGTKIGYAQIPCG